jgi:succinoglycan biosynthesis transport protein ExoP
MNNLEKYLDQVIEQKPVVYEPPEEIPPAPPEEPPTVNLLASVRRRWYLVAAVAIVLCALALPAIWLLVEPQYTVQGAVKVRPVIPGIISDATNPATAIGGYSEYVNTQAILLTSGGSLLQAVADDLSRRNLGFITGAPQSRLEKIAALVLPSRAKKDPAQVLRDAIAKKTITATALPRTELIAVAMRTSNVDEAKTIVDSFVRNYVLQSGAETNKGEIQNLSLLETQLDQLQKRIKSEREQIRALADQYGTTVLAPRQEMEFNVQARLMSELIQLESQRIAAEAKVGLLEKMEKIDLSPEQVVTARREYVNADPMVTELTKRIVEMKRDLIQQQVVVKDHPRLVQEQAALGSMEKSLEAKRKELEQEFDSTLDARQREAVQQRLTAAKLDLDQIKAHYDKIDEVVKNQDESTRKVGRANMDIQDAQFQLQVDQDQYDTLYRRTKTLQMEKERPARVETAYWAELSETKDRRGQLTFAAVVGALACGFGLALLRDRMDKTLQTPEDVLRQLDLPVLGTTTSSHAVKPALLAEQIAGDYQTIRTNLGLMNDGELPRRLVVSSAGTREGKTTFAVNLATSLAKSGKKVLLVDGDLRKPDVGQMLNVPKDTYYLQDVLLGTDPSLVTYQSPVSGLHILAANPRHMADPYELLTSSMAAEQVERLSREYDHLIIDSPPALAFPDALVWARLADAVVLVGFAGQTTAPDLREARERFARGRARVLGAVLSNVPLDQNLYRYAYTYRVRSASGRAAKPKKLLLASQQPGDDNPVA